MNLQEHNLKAIAEAVEGCCLVEYSGRIITFWVQGSSGLAAPGAPAIGLP